MYKRLPQTMSDEEKIIATLDYAIVKIQMKKHELKIKRWAYYGFKDGKREKEKPSKDPIGELHEFIQNNRSEI
jgi:hypothetical protein